MYRSRFRLHAVVLAFIFLPAASGVIAFHASATCERFVRTYVTKPVRTQVGKVTAEAWARWRVEHPDWKPNPNLHRPRVVMTRDEAVQKVQFACSVETEPADTTQMLPPLQIPPPYLAPPPMVQLPPTELTEVEFPELFPPNPVDSTPVVILPLVPLSGPPPFGGAVPEPATLGLSLLGMAGLGGMAGGGAVKKAEERG